MTAVGVRTSYFTFGPDHVHSYDGERVSSDCIVKITAPDPRAVMFDHFSNRWSFEYSEEQGPVEIAKWHYRVIDVA